MEAQSQPHKHRAAEIRKQFWSPSSPANLVMQKNGCEVQIQYPSSSLWSQGGFPRPFQPKADFWDCSDESSIHRLRKICYHSSGSDLHPIASCFLVKKTTNPFVLHWAMCWNILVFNPSKRSAWDFRVVTSFLLLKASEVILTAKYLILAVSSSTISCMVSEGTSNTFHSTKPGRSGS